MGRRIALGVLGIAGVAILAAGIPTGQQVQVGSAGLQTGRARAPKDPPKPVPTLWQRQMPLPPPTLSFDPKAPVVDANKEASTTSPGSGDLETTIDVQINQEIIDKAAELGTARAMYEFVRNDCAFQPYYGSRKGSIETLRQQAGNDYDLASLLIALLRASGIPSRYGEGMVEIPVDRVTSWLDVEDGTVAGSILFTNGLEGVAVVSGPDVVAVRCQRVWVEAFVQEGFGSPAWFVLDPAFKLSSTQPGIDIPEEMGLDPQAFMEEYYDPSGGGVTLPRPETPIELLTQDVADYVAINYPGLTVDDVVRASQVVPEELGLLPRSLPYTVRAYDASFSEIPASRRYQIRFHLYDGGTNLIDHTVDLPTVASQRITISYVGATPADQAIIDSNNGLLYTPPNLIDVRPELKVGGTVEAMGAAGIGAGRVHSSDIHFLAPVNDSGLPVNVVPAIFNTIIAGQAQAIGLAVHGVTNRFLAPVDPLDHEGFLFQLPHATAMSYLDRGVVADGRLGALLHARVTHDVDDAIVEEQILVTTDGGGNPTAWEWRGLTVDADRKIVGVWKVDEFQTGCGGEGTDFLTVGGAEASLNESLIYEDDFTREAVSTIKILQLAADQGITIHHRWSSTTLPGDVTLPPSVQAAIVAAIASGHVVTFPNDEIPHFNWTGSGYIDMDPCTGAAGYIIAGGQNGGSTVDTWTNTIWWTNPFKTVECIEGDVETPAADFPDGSALFCKADTTPLRFVYRVRVRYDDGTYGFWWTYSHDSKRPSDLAPGDYVLTVGDKSPPPEDANPPGTANEHQRDLRIVEVTIDPLTRANQCDGLPPTVSRDVQVTITPSLAGTGHTVHFDITGTDGTATVTADQMRDTSGPITVTGGTGAQQTSVGGGENRRVRARVDGTDFCGQSDPFAVCAHPTNSRETLRRADPGAILHFEYAWESDSGDLAHLDQVLWGEHVSYGGIPAPNPPFTDPGWGTVSDPTVLNVPGVDGVAQDNHGNLPMSAGPADSWIATQHYRYRCARCVPDGASADENDVSWGTIVMGPITISRLVENVGGWRYRITKQGISATRPLP